MSLRILLALATLKDLRVFAWDVDSAYLHGRIDNDIYISFPDGYSKLGRVGKVNKVLYGLLEATCVWREDLEEKLKTLGFTAIDTHVDGGTGIFSSEEEELKLKADIQRFYKIKEKDTSRLFKVLGIQQKILNRGQSNYHNPNISTLYSSGST